MYRFALCQTHPKCPDVQGWYLILEPDDLDTLMKLHKGVISLYYHTFGMDPHIDKSDLAWYYNPIRLGASWLGSMEKFLAAGTTLAVNYRGGMVSFDGLKVLNVIESKLLHWPDIQNDEVITISRWPHGHHYYLASDVGQVFVPDKYVRYEDARRAAEKYTDNINDKGC
jgi:hypothetical protein